MRDRPVGGCIGGYRFTRLGAAADPRLRRLLTIGNELGEKISPRPIGTGRVGSGHDRLGRPKIDQRGTHGAMPYVPKRDRSRVVFRNWQPLCHGAAAPPCPTRLPVSLKALVIVPAEGPLRTAGIPRCSERVARVIGMNPDVSECRGE